MKSMHLHISSFSIEFYLNWNRVSKRCLLSDLPLRRKWPTFPSDYTLKNVGPPIFCPLKPLFLLSSDPRPMKILKKRPRRRPARRFCWPFTWAYSQWFSLRPRWYLDPRHKSELWRLCGPKSRPEQPRGLQLEPWPRGWWQPPTCSLTYQGDSPPRDRKLSIAIWPDRKCPRDMVILPFHPAWSSSTRRF